VPTLLLNRPIAFPIAAIRKALIAHLPDFAWRVGEEDVGALDQSVPLERPQTILGRTREAMVLIGVEQVHSTFEPANGHVPPQHRIHVSISRPSTEDDAMARLITLLIGASLGLAGDESARLQLEPGGNWYGIVDMRALLRSAADDPGLAQRGLIGTPEHGVGEADRPVEPIVDTSSMTASFEATSMETSERPAAEEAVAEHRKDLRLATFFQALEPLPVRRAGGFGRKGL
jgi:hypothetical protein